MKSFSTILQALSHRATETPDRVVFIWVDTVCEEQDKMTFKQLEGQSNAVAVRLLKLGCQKGDRVMIAYPFGLEFLAGMFGAMKIGVIPCSIYPPNPNQLKTDMPKMPEPSSLHTTRLSADDCAGPLKTGVTWLDRQANNQETEPQQAKDIDLCRNQKTFASSSTSAYWSPQRVMISHKNLAENCIAISAMSGVNASNAGSTLAALWVPQYHNGACGGFMTTLFAGTSLVMASPLDFVVNPLLWTDMVEHYQANLTCAPNFAYALLLKRLEQANRTATGVAVGITVEGRKGFDKSANEDLAVQISNHVSQVHGLLVSDVVVLKLGVTPKTTSGKLKRSEIRQTTFAGDWKASDVLLRFQRQAKLSPIQAKVSSFKRSSFLEHSFAMNGVTSSEFYLSEGTQHEIRRRSITLPFGSLELPDNDLSQTNAIPSQAVEAVHAVECDPSKLDEYFLELHLSGVSGMDEAWSKATKTTAAMQEMCSQILQHLEDKYPTICQLAKTLSENPDWILIDDRTCFLSKLVHQIFVLQWVTTFLMDNLKCMQHKLQNDAAWEAQTQNDRSVPVELQEMLNLPEKDSMYGKWPFFLWIKNRSILAQLNLLVQSLRSPEGPGIENQLEKLNDLQCLNLLEAVWLEKSNGLKDNSEVGRLLASYPLLTARTQSMMALLEPQSSTWNDLYIAWNMHFWIQPNTSFSFFAFAGSADKDSSTWMASKLLLPCIIGDVNASFFYARTTSLYLVLQTIGRKTTSPKYYTQSILSRRALEIFGRLNLSWAQELGYSHPPLGNDKGMTLNEEDWLSLFDQWGSENQKAQTTNPNSDINASKSGAGATDPADFSIRYDNIIMSVFGSHIDTSKSWAENGLTSLKSAELRSRVEEELFVVLSPNFEQLYPTPKALAVFLTTSEGESFPTQDLCDHPGFLWNSSGSSLSLLLVGVIQTTGILAILLLLFASVVPSYFLVTWVLGNCDLNEEGECRGLVFWVLLPLVFPLFILSFSVIVVICKVAVVRKYQSQQFELLSWNFVCWWFVDRILDIWESLVGQFLLETKFIWIFYKVLGADLAWSAKIESHIREFDLVTIGDNSVISHPMKSRKFSHANRDANPKITFYPIVVGKNCKISGMVSPGAKIGDGSKVEKLSVVDEGAIVPDGVLAQGNPAYNAGSFEHQESLHLEESMLDIFKIFWMVLEAYHFFALSFLVHVSLNSILPDWRYATIVHWIFLVPVSSLLALLTSIALKWVLIGKRDPSDEYEGTLYRRATNWACDFHFRIAAWTLAPFTGQSRLWNLILFVHGLDIDMESGPDNPYFIFPPSKVDFVKIRESFVATISLDFSKKGNSKVEIINSSVGYNINLHAGVKIMQSTVPPRTNVPDSIYDLNQSGQPMKMNLILPEVAQMLLNVVLFASLIPAFELGLVATKSSSIMVTSCGLAAAFILQLLLWLLLTWAVERLLLVLPNHLQFNLFGIYLNHVWIFRNQNWLVYLLYGTPMFAYFARLMGAEVDGELWYFGNTLYECGKLHYTGCTIIDGSSLNGHYIDGKGLTINDTYVSGVVHPGCFAVAGSVVAGEENGPWKVFLQANDGAGVPRETIGI
ncbi:non-ribosomal peptide synthetase [Seminavis robusta]|uniref:Non-ribosomal peptide synthetase n=1 Tax=Seminavis robusta TaxID=568900 RepID=A0A9N8DG31_9STRA|nr:non-ribosomal peptide synthetase [Seminavis robusta]